MKSPFNSQYHLLEKLSMCYHFAETVLEAVNLCGMLSGVCFVMSGSYFLYTNLISFILNFGKTVHAFVLLGPY